MRRCRIEGFAKHPFSWSTVFIALSGSVGLGCTTYSDVDLDEPRDSSTPMSDATKPPSDTTPGDTATPPTDMGGTADTGGDIDGATNDSPRDTPREVAPPADTTAPDAGDDASIDADAAGDVTPPSADADATVPPLPDGGPDGGPRDVIEAGPRDADATVPPADADGGPGTVDVRDSGPTCWGTPSTHDEDNDGVVDECDNCPSVSNANQADVSEINSGGSADGVGDACDPRPNSGGDSIFFFDGMNFTALPATWTNVGVGGWTASGSALTPTGTATGQELQRSFPSALGNYLAETGLTFTALTINGSASIPFRTDASRNGWGCAVGINNSVGQIVLTQVTAGTGEASPTTMNINAPQVGSRYRLLAGGYSTNVYCMLSSGERLPARTTSSSTSGESGIRASGASASFEYLLVYRLGGTVP
ncbi:MAG TPA: hypothetical protein VK550_27170 [Polyangiaceae bacterium]|nr:hypothetical protein [Polyangiaceae bacterium]